MRLHSPPLFRLDELAIRPIKHVRKGAKVEMIGHKNWKASFTETPTTLKLAAFVMALATVLVPTFLSWYDYSVWQLILAMVLLDVCLYPTAHYIVNKESGPPIMPVLCIAFAVQYAIPIFTQEAKIELVNELLYLENRAVVTALILSIVGVIAMQVTYYLTRSVRATKVIPCFSLYLSETRAEAFCVTAFFLSLLATRIQNMLSQETALQFSALFNLLQNQVLVAIGLLTWLAFSLRKRKRHMIMLYFLIAFASLRGFSTTMLEAILLPLAVLFIGKWTFTKKLPLGSLAAIAAGVLFFSPVKMEIRRVALDEAQTGRASSSTSRAVDWVNQASEFWWETLSGRRRLSESATDASSRTDLVHQFAYMREVTPTLIPYQYGADYYYFLISPIPRAIWPDKPAATESAVRFEVDYGLTTEEGTKGTTIGPTLIGEGYINFGIAGSVLVMLFQGFILSLLEQVFARKSPGGTAVFLAVFVFLLNGLGSSLAVIFGGTLQALVSGSLLIWLFSHTPPGLSRLGRRSHFRPPIAYSHDKLAR